MHRTLSLKWALPIGLALMLLLFVGFATFNSLSNSHDQLTRQAKRDILEHAAHLARMAEQGLQSRAHEPRACLPRFAGVQKPGIDLLARRSWV